MKTIGPYERLIFDKTITEPKYLIEITLNEPMHLSSREGVSMNGVWWEESKIKLGEIQENEATLQIYNADYEFTQGALTGAFLRRPVKIYSAFGFPHILNPYVTPGYWASAYVGTPKHVPRSLLFDGYINATPEIGEWLSITCTRNLPRLYPRVKIRPPFANHLPAVGSVIERGGETYRIDD